jgi:hypothetical protein
VTLVRFLKPIQKPGLGVHFILESTNDARILSVVKQLGCVGLVTWSANPEDGSEGSVPQFERGVVGSLMLMERERQGLVTRAGLE